jgi:hypothetical protein
MSKAAVGDGCSRRPITSQETSIIVTGTARADKRAPERPRDRRKNVRSWVSHDYPITRRNTASTTFSTGVICGSAANGSRRPGGCAWIINAVRDFFNVAASSRRYAHLHTGSVRGTTTLFPAQH